MTAAPYLVLRRRRISGSGADAYAIGGASPELVAAFTTASNGTTAGEYFRKAGSETTFSGLFTHSASSNATMVDSDGLLKWRPHNLLTYSDNLSSGAYTEYNGGTLVGNEFTFVNSNSYLLIRNLFGQPVKGKFTLKATISGDTPGDTFSLELVDSADGSDSNKTTVTVSTTPTEYVVEADFSASTTFSGNLGAFINRILPASVTAGSKVTLTNVHLYRSDLGGMVNNPDRGDSYVPTTSSAVYLPRRGHHVYNGTSWVNEGLLHESEARVNLLPYSEDRTNASWNNTNVTVGSDGTSILGMAASKITFGSGVNLFAENIGFVIGNYVTLSALVARGDADDHGGAHRFGFYDTTAASDVGYINFNYGTGATSVQSGSVLDHGSKEVEGGWLIYMTIAHTSGNNLTSYFGAVGADAGTGYFYLAAPQVEAAPTPSSYIPTSGSTVTRAAETLTVPAAKLPYSATALSIQMQGRMTYADTGAVLSSDGQSGEVIPWRLFVNTTNYIDAVVDTESANTGKIWFMQEVGGVFDYSATSGDYLSPGINVPYNIASRHGSTFINGAVDGTALTADTTPTALPDLSATDLNLGYDYMGTIKLFRIWADDLTDAGLEAASS